MRIVQTINSLCFGDAIGNSIQAIDKLLKRMGYDTAIFALNVDSKIPKDRAVACGKNPPPFLKDDIIIHHVAGASPMHQFVTDTPNKKMMVYRNVTPPEFFEPYNLQTAQNCRLGLEQVKGMQGKFDWYLAVSEFNRQDLIRMGYDGDRISVLPVFAPMDEYENTPDYETIQKYSDGVTNLVFVGRVAPNKKHETIIRAYDYYKKNINPNSRLIFVGRGDEKNKYYEDLKYYIEKLQVPDVIFSGQVSFSQILAYYRCADVFMCMSEHEGFCVPLIEAMYFGVPIIAYDACAVPETLGGSGILLDDKNPILIAKVIDRLVQDPELRNHVINSQKERLKDFSFERVSKLYSNFLWDFIENK